MQNLHVAEEPDVFRADACEEEVSEVLEKALADPRTIIEIAMIDGVPAGYIWYEHQEIPRSALKKAMSRVYIHQVASLPAQRRKGVGRALMESALSYAEERGVQTIDLDSWSFNSKAHRFFESFGFDVYKIKMRLRI